MVLVVVVVELRGLDDRLNWGGWDALPTVDLGVAAPLPALSHGFSGVAIKNQPSDLDFGDWS